MVEDHKDKSGNVGLVMGTPPPKSRGRPRKSMEARFNVPQFVTDSLLGTPLTERMDTSVAEGKTTRTRSRGRRKEITPMKIAMDSDTESGLDSSKIGGGVPVTVEQTVDDMTEYGLPRSDTHRMLDQPRLRHSQSPLQESLPAHQIAGQQGDDVWRSMIRPESASPSAGSGGSREQSDIDPTNEHYEYDTILESEGFSMVSVESLGSTGNQSYQSAQPSDIPHDHEITPAVVTSPSEPPALDNSNSRSLPRQLDESREGTPKLVRVVRAGNALQGALSPKDRGQRLSASFSGSGKHPSLAAGEKAASPLGLLSKDKSPKQCPGDLFGGFGAGTRRELRAGLRLGEELAKRQQKSNEQTRSSLGADEDVFHAATSPQYPLLAGSDTQMGYNLTFPDSKPGSEEDVRYPQLSRTQLLTPERSDADEDEDRMSWKADTHAHSENTAGSAAMVVPSNAEENSTIDYTMMARETEWQREREAISRQIEMANKSQVIVIDSDDESDREEKTQTEDQQHGSDGDEELSDIWQAEAHSLEYSRDTTPEVSNIILQPDIIKPRRSKLPSPWRRSSQMFYSDESEPTDSDLSWQMRQVQVKDPPMPTESKEKSLNDTECVSHLDESTGELIARQLSPVKESDIGISNKNNKLLDQTIDSWQPDDSTGALLTRQLSPVKGFNFSVVAPETTSVSNSPKGHVLHSEDSGELPAGATNMSATPESTSREELDETLQENMTIHSIDTQPVETSLEKPRDKHLGKVIENDTTPIDPNLLQPRKQTKKSKPKPAHAPQAPLATQPTSPAQTSWISRLTAPIWSVLTPGSALPPPATKADILCSSPYEPICQLTPWESCHMRALGPLYLSSLFYGAHIFPLNSKGPSAAYLGATVATSLGWSRTITKRDCSVADAFMVILDERGFALADPGEQWIEEGLVVRMCVSFWVSMVMRGEVGMDASKGEKVGLRRERDRLWTPEDIRWEDNASEYFERKRREFDGLPSWKAMGIKWPPR